MDKQERCRVSKNRRPCGQPAIYFIDTPDLGVVPMCEACYLDVRDRIGARLKEWAKRLAAGESLLDLH